MRKLLEVDAIATYGVPPSGCDKGCCQMWWQNEEAWCHIKVPYPCQTTGSQCLEALPQTCCSGVCAVNEAEVPTCQPLATGKDWNLGGTCTPSIDLSCWGIPTVDTILNFVKSVLKK